MASSDRESPFVKKMKESFRRNDKPHLKMSTFTVFFESDESEKIKKPRFIFKRNDSDKGITCFRSEAIRVAKALPEMYTYLAETRESFEAEADKSNIEGRVHSEIIPDAGALPLGNGKRRPLPLPRKCHLQGRRG
jgi:hypothetical protein